MSIFDKRGTHFNPPAYIEKKKILPYNVIEIGSTEAYKRHLLKKAEQEQQDKVKQSEIDAERKERAIEIFLTTPGITTEGLMVKETKAEKLKRHAKEWLANLWYNSFTKYS